MSNNNYEIIFFLKVKDIDGLKNLFKETVKEKKWRKWGGSGLEPTINTVDILLDQPLPQPQP